VSELQAAVRACVRACVRGRACVDAAAAPPAAGEEEEEEAARRAVLRAAAARAAAAARRARPGGVRARHSACAITLRAARGFGLAETPSLNEGPPDTRAPRGQLHNLQRGAAPRRGARPHARRARAAAVRARQ
jgi:hypothetical protein